jgi:hypothetical protein
MDLTCSDINMLYLTGFTFFTTSTVYSNSIGIDQTLHNQSSQILFVKNQSFSNQKLLLDKTIRQILWKNEYQWIEYQWNLIKQHLVINSINDKSSGIHEKISLKHTLWTWNIYQVATLYVYDELQWKNVLTIDCKELELPEQNIFGNVIHQKNKNPLPVWLKSWWFIQQSWMNHVIIPNEDKNHDSFIPTIWLWTHTTKSTENPFSDSYYLPMSDIMMGNISFNNVLIGTNQCRWIESMEDFIKLVDWKLFFE